MFRSTILLIFTVFFTLPEAKSGLTDIFNTSSDYNLASALDTVFALKRNDIKLLYSGTITTPMEEEVTFWCGNRRSPMLSQTYLEDPNVHQKIDFTKPIMLVTHGWLDDHSLIWIQQIAQDAIHFLDTNVCIVGWDQLAKYNYFQAARQNCRLVSDYLTRFVNFLVQQGIPLDVITLAGHSLGAHICGQVGNNLNGQIAEIYGIDPAGPLFTFPVDVGKENRLDKSDAKYVQMILTTRYKLGVGSGDGHENFYPNGGTSPQPNCIFPVSSDAEAADQIFCSHLHAASLFRLSLNPSNSFKGRECMNWVSYVLRSCMFNQRDSLGVYNQRYAGAFYLLTLADTPYVKKF